MRSEVVSWVTALVLAGMFGAVMAFGVAGGAIWAAAAIGLLLITYGGWSMRSSVDSSWIVRWVVAGYLAKIVGTFARHYMVTVFYAGGDSFRYYRAGTEMAQAWHRGGIPALSGNGAFGTQIVEWVSGALFAIFNPDLLGGFLIFGFLAYLGQVFFYLAFRRWAEPHHLKPYAFFILFLPTYMFWPSSVGKDALVVLTLGACAYFVSRALESYEIRWLIGLSVSLAGLGLIRVHIAALVLAALVGTALIARQRSDAKPGTRGRRLLVLGAAIAAGLFVISFFPGVLGVDLSATTEVDGFTADVVRRTSESGTIAAGDPVSGPEDIPGALALVLFRPFIFEAREIQHLFAALETTLLLVLTLVKLPVILRNLGSWRENAYLVFATIYTVGFAIAFSVVRNLGIIARQRGQVLAFFIAFLVILGWKETGAPTEDITAVPEPPARAEEARLRAQPGLSPRAPAR